MVDNNNEPSKVLINIEEDLQQRTVEGIKNKMIKKKWNLKTTICDDLDEKYKGKMPFNKN